MSDADDNYCTLREIQNVFSHEMAKLDKDIWPRENSGSPPRSLVLEHFERFKHELFKVARKPRKHQSVHISPSDRPSGESPELPEPSEWDTVAQAEFERNKQRHIEDTARARRSAALGLGRGET